MIVLHRIPAVFIFPMLCDLKAFTVTLCTASDVIKDLRFEDKDKDKDLWSKDKDKDLNE